MKKYTNEIIKSRSENVAETFKEIEERDRERGRRNVVQEYNWIIKL